MHRCGLLLQTEWRGLCACVGHTGELCKTDEPIEMPFGQFLRVNSCEHEEPGISWRPGFSNEKEALWGNVSDTHWTTDADASSYGS